MSQLELHARIRDWMRARARDRQWWPTPAAWARALLLLADSAMVRARAQARLWGGDTNRELFALMRGVERIADERFVVVRDGEATRVSGPRQPHDPRPPVIKRAAGLAGIEQTKLLAEADRQEQALREGRRSNLRGLELAERYMATLPRTKAPTQPPPLSRPSQGERARNTLMPCGGGEFVFVGIEVEPLDIDLELLFDDGEDLPEYEVDL